MWNYVLPLLEQIKIFIRLMWILFTSRLNLIIGLRYDYDNLSKEEATKAITTTLLDLILIIS
jgi:hypothetical protein